MNGYGVHNACFVVVVCCFVSCVCVCACVFVCVRERERERDVTNDLIC